MEENCFLVAHTNNSFWQQKVCVSGQSEVGGTLGERA